MPTLWSYVDVVVDHFLNLNEDDNDNDVQSMYIYRVPLSFHNFYHLLCEIHML